MRCLLESAAPDDLFSSLDRPCDLGGPLSVWHLPVTAVAVRSLRRSPGAVAVPFASLSDLPRPAPAPARRPSPVASSPSAPPTGSSCGALSAIWRSIFGAVGLTALCNLKWLSAHARHTAACRWLPAATERDIDPIMWCRLRKSAGHAAAVAAARLFNFYFLRALQMPFTDTVPCLRFSAADKPWGSAGGADWV